MHEGVSLGNFTEHLELVSASRERGGGGGNGSTQEEDWDMS